MNGRYKESHVHHWVTMRIKGRRKVIKFQLLVWPAPKFLSYTGLLESVIIQKSH